jgi:IclR family transcriptional regulator, acetate operon repressor
VAAEPIPRSSQSVSYSAVKSVERALEIVELLARTRGGTTAAELAHRLRLNRAIVFRLLASLAAAGFVSQHEPGPHYRLTFKLVSLANLYSDSLEISDLFVPVLRRLSDQTGELIQLALAEGDHLVRVAKAEGSERLRVASPLGSRPILHASASGRAWLSAMPEDRALALVYQQVAQEPEAGPVRSIDELREALVTARHLGFAATYELTSAGVCAVGAPIVVHRSRLETRPVGAVSLSAPTARVSRERLTECGPLVADAAQEIARSWPAGWP